MVCPEVLVSRILVPSTIRPFSRSCSSIYDKTISLELNKQQNMYDEFYLLLINDS